MKPIPTADRTMLDELRESGLARDLEGRIEQRVRRNAKRRTRMKRAAAATVAVFLVAVWLVPWMRSTSAIATASAHRQVVALPDGSSVHLNARTAIETDFRYGRRIVRLSQGEAHFVVVKDEKRPFLVETAQGDRVEVLGTEFNVRLASLPQGVTDSEVTLFSGAVSLRTKLDGAAELRPGEQGSARGVRKLTEAELASVASWREGRLMLDGLTLTEIADRFAAYHGVIITVDPRVASLELSGSLPLDDIERLISTLNETEALHAFARRHQAYHIGPR